METNFDKLLNTFNKNMEHDKNGFELYSVIYKIIKEKFENKPCNTKVVTAIKEELIKTYPNININYSKSFFYFQLKIWGDKFGGYTNQHQFLLSQHNVNLSSSEFAEQNSRYSQGAVERLAAISKISVADALKVVIKKREELMKVEQELHEAEKVLIYNIDENLLDFQ